MRRMKLVCEPRLVVLLWMLLLWPCLSVVGDAGSEFLAMKERDVERIVSGVIANSHRCEMLAICGTSTNYYHVDECAPSLGDTDYSLRGSSNTSCEFNVLGYTRRYKRLPQPTNLKDVAALRSICFKRALHPLMKEIASLNPSTHSLPFFGSLDGSWQQLPGSDQSGDDIRGFDPRLRPWYRASTSVVKVVVVLIDLAPSMNNDLPPDIGAGALLEAAKEIANQVLLTLYAGDHVNIIVFDSTRVIQLASSAVLVQNQRSTEQVELDPLRLELSKQTVQTENKQSDFNAAVLAALRNFDSNPQAAKVILVITDGVFATLGNVTLPSTNLTDVKVFLYKLPQSDDNNISLAGNTLVQQLCAVGGHFEPILTNLENPLLALHKYFSYLANLKRILTGGRPQYSFVHHDFEQIGGNIILIIKPVFFGDNLIGVAGVSIYIQLLGSLANAVNQALQSKIVDYSVPTALVLLTAANCSIMNDALGALSDNIVWSLANACGGSSNSDFTCNGGLCLQTDKTSIIYKPAACSGVCSEQNESGSSSSNKTLAAVVYTTSVLAVFFLTRKMVFKRNYETQDRIPHYFELENIEANPTEFLDYYRLAIESVESVQNIVNGASESPLQLNEGQCKILAEELAKVRDYLLARTNRFMANQNEMKALRHSYYAIRKAELLVEKCCCKTSESWIVTAMTLVEIQECFAAIILDLRQWRMVLDNISISAIGASCHTQEELLMSMDEEYQDLYKKLHRGNDYLQQAAIEDKKKLGLKLGKLQESKNSLEYLRAIHLQTWLAQFEDEAQVVDVNLQEKLIKYEGPEFLGRGGCGTVFRVTWLGIRCALKMLDVKDEREATALKGLFHPNIIRLYHYWDAPSHNPTSHLLMELMSMDLTVCIEETSTGDNEDAMPFSLPVAIDIMLQVAQAMQYLHEKHLTHRDLKTSNILVRQVIEDLTNLSEGYLDIKLADFGLAKAYDNTSTGKRHTVNRGTPVYGAPEIFGKDLAAERNFPPMADVWSFGVTCAEILSGKEPYLNEPRNTLQSKIANENLRPVLPKHCPPYLAFCITSCWEFEPQRRPDFASICKMLRHAKLLSLNLTNLDDSRPFLAYTTRSGFVKGLPIGS
ncbi:hypothetical protein M758_2G239800 [Ceratodon purpureus]|nr:hypothetical protein M758_2G239800 [Ceratodon purpureus]KAG0627944.1 hypothetical protein M758_2G239800 [Ceratodon purpureus]